MEGIAKRHVHSSLGKYWLYFHHLVFLLTNVTNKTQLVQILSADLKPSEFGLASYFAENVSHGSNLEILKYTNPQQKQQENICLQPSLFSPNSALKGLGVFRGEGKVCHRA
jgi:hypothetical protein